MSPTSTALVRACSLLLCLAAGSWQLSIKEFVVPKAVELGNDAELRCQYELDANDTETALFVKWWWRPESATKDDREQIYQRIAGHAAQPVHNNNFSEIDIKDNDTIILKNVTTVDSGTFECEVSAIKEVRQHGQLVVFHMGTGPILNFTEIDDPTAVENKNKLILLTCVADNVAPKPILSVTIDHDVVNITSVVDDDNNGLYSIYANATLSTEAVAESEVSCEMFYLNANIPHPAYVDVKKFKPSGYDTQFTTVMPEDSTQPDSTPESLQTPRGDGIQLHSSWILLVIAAIVPHLQPIFKLL